MKILSARQIREWDATSIRRQGITALSLMERAASACVQWLAAHYPVSVPFLVLCGRGNNGGDGLAITRLLLAKGYAATALLLQPDKGLLADNAANLEALKTVSLHACRALAEGERLSSLAPEIILIDALFGTGLNRPLAGNEAGFVQHLNDFPNEKISIDLPSGLPADEAPAPSAQVVCATHTLCFQQYKKSMLHPEGGRFCGSVHLLDIGLDTSFQATASSAFHTLDLATVQALYHPRSLFAHKGDLGLACIIAGSYGMMGAAVLAAQAAGRAGAGKVLGLIPGLGYTTFQTGAPEAMCCCSGQEHIEDFQKGGSAQGIGIGPGLGKHPQTASALIAFLKQTDRPVVLDADALNLLAEHPSWRKHIPRGSILTPHPGEFARLFGKPADSFARVAQARMLAMKHHFIILAKDARSLIALPDGTCFYVVQGSPALATAGSGDVLLGILTGLLAQGYSPEAAALLGAYLHAVAGSRAAEHRGIESVLAGDLVAHIGAAFLTLRPA